MQSKCFTRIARVSVAIFAGCVLAGCSVFSGDDGRNDPTPLKEYKAGLSAQVGWKAQIGGGVASIGFAPAVVRDVVFAATGDGSVARYDLSSGAVGWKIKLDQKLSAGVGSDGTTTAVVATDGTVIALDETGQVKWRTKASSEVVVPLWWDLVWLQCEVVITGSRHSTPKRESVFGVFSVQVPRFPCVLPHVWR